MDSSFRDKGKRPIRLGVAGLGRGFTVMLPALARDPRIALVAAADPRPEGRARFASDFSARTYDTVEALCGDPDVEAIYVATPHQHHARHAQLAARRGKHILVEKPMAVTLAECSAMIEAAARGKVRLIVGHSHSFDAPILRARALIASGEFGALRMIHALNYTDFTQRPRRPEERDTTQGGGVVFSQGAHQVDVVRLLAGGGATSVFAATSPWTGAPTEAAYAALLTFAGGAFASLTYSGFGHFDSDEFQGWIGEMGQKKEPGVMRRVPSFAGAAAEIANKNARNYGGADYVPANTQNLAHQHFGVVIASCERADLRPTPGGVMIYQDGAARLDPLLLPAVPRSEVIDELYAAVVEGKPTLHGGEWARATVEVCCAIVQSAKEKRPIPLTQQVTLP